MNRQYYILAGIILLLLFFALPFTGFIIYTHPDHDLVLVTRVIDGDTVEIESGENVRLLGIDTPERGQILFQEAKEFLQKRIEGKEVVLKIDKTDKDKYGRLLRYVFLDDALVNIELVENGLAEVLIYEPDNMYEDALYKSENIAKENNLGIWNFQDQNLFCLGIFHLHYNARDNDNMNLNDEFVKFRNFCETPLDLGGWIIYDKINTTYTFPEITVETKEYISVHSGEGKDNQTDLFWGNNRAIWNNKGDEIRVYNKEGLLMLNYSYSN